MQAYLINPLEAVRKVAGRLQMCANGQNFLEFTRNMSNILLKFEKILPRFHPFSLERLLIGQALR